MAWKASHYTHLIPLSDGNGVVYNGRSGALVKLSPGAEDSCVGRGLWLYQTKGLLNEQGCRESRTPQVARTPARVTALVAGRYRVGRS